MRRLLRARRQAHAKPCAIAHGDFYPARIEPRSSVNRKGCIGGLTKTDTRHHLPDHAFCTTGHGETSAGYMRRRSYWRSDTCRPSHDDN